MFKYAKKGLTPSQIGVVLRDSFGIPQVKAVTGSKILRILKVRARMRAQREMTIRLRIGFATLLSHSDLLFQQQQAHCDVSADAASLSLQRQLSSISGNSMHSHTSARAGLHAASILSMDPGALFHSVILLDCYLPFLTCAALHAISHSVCRSLVLLLSCPRICTTSSRR
jgi:hypothetical protein